MITPCYSWLFSPSWKDMGSHQKKRESGHIKVQGIQKKKKNVDTWRSNEFQEKDSPCPKENKREIAHGKEFIYHPQIPHTCTS